LLIASSGRATSMSFLRVVNWSAVGFKVV
jgi:hypothetical protein